MRLVPRCVALQTRWGCVVDRSRAAKATDAATQRHLERARRLRAHEDRPGLHRHGFLESGNRQVVHISAFGACVRSHTRTRALLGSPHLHSSAQGSAPHVAIGAGEGFGRDAILMCFWAGEQILADPAWRPLVCMVCTATRVVVCVTGIWHSACDRKSGRKSSHPIPTDAMSRSALSVAVCVNMSASPFPRRIGWCRLAELAELVRGQPKDGALSRCFCKNTVDGLSPRSGRAGPTPSKIE